MVNWPNIPNTCIIHKKNGNIWLRDFSNTLDIKTYCFKYFQLYILIQMYQNQQRKKLELFTKIF